MLQTWAHIVWQILCWICTAGLLLGLQTNIWGHWDITHKALRSPFHLHTNLKKNPFWLHGKSINKFLIKTKLWIPPPPKLENMGTLCWLEAANESLDAGREICLLLWLLLRQVESWCIEVHDTLTGFETLLHNTASYREADSQIPSATRCLEH